MCLVRDDRADGRGDALDGKPKILKRSPAGVDLSDHGADAAP
jgi:hypothetical protein